MKAILRNVNIFHCNFDYFHNNPLLKSEIMENLKLDISEVFFFFLLVAFKSKELNIS